MSVKSRVESTISDNKVVVFSKSYCPYCRRAKSLFSTEFPDAQVTVVELDEDAEGSDIQAYLAQKTGQSTVPNIFINNRHVGGADELESLHRDGRLRTMLAEGDVNTGPL
ncbi:glutaredoxin [Peniophora sp. CONT]|nr:glutaredoxin [Peniophora sp. CONT]